MDRIPFNKRWSVLTDGLQTVLGLRRMGAFVPLKHAEMLAETPPAYPAWEAWFAAHSGTFVRSMEEIATAAPDLQRAICGPLGQHWGRGFSGVLDCAALFAIAHRGKASRIVEVGSGVSTHILAAAAPGAAITCIDPQPRTSVASLPVLWEKTVLGDRHLGLFRDLRRGDIAFFDSSHVLLQGTDVDIIFNRILPDIRPGVLVHLHDINFPDPYPSGWRLRNYSEQLGLSGWCFSGAFRPLFAAHYSATRLRRAAAAAYAAVGYGGGAEVAGSSLWLERRECG